jgi:hypothetical protein
VPNVFARLDAAGRRAILLFVNGVVCGASGYLMFRSEHRAVNFLSGIVVRITLFVLRREIRWFYGLIEIVFALFVLYDSSGKGRGDFGSDFGVAFSKFQFNIVVIQMFGAIYVLIRGLDNLFQGAPPLRAWWEARDS